MPSVAEMIRMRVLPLDGQVVPIYQYQDLFNVKWSPAIQNSGDWWYKCTSNGTRDADGSYFQVLDHRGVASRAAGVNSKYRMANDTPYDGGAIGAHLPDALQAHIHPYQLTSSSLMSAQGSDYGVVYIDNNRMNTDNNSGRAAAETRMATIASYYCMKY
jgi:hypothetical protein